jgi:FkbM family methyltransferase
MLEQIIKESKKILDIGANIGQTFLEYKSINPQAKILSIEANPKCEDSLRECGADYLICALGNEQSNKSFFINSSEKTCQGASFFKENTQFYADGQYDTINLETIRLDDLLGDSDFDLIKIDTQGSEMPIICGGEGVLQKAKWVLLELPVVEYNKGSEKMQDIIKKMMSIGFLPHYVVGENKFGKTIVQIDVLFKRNENAKKVKSILLDKLEDIIKCVKYFNPDFYIEIGCYRLGTSIDVLMSSRATSYFFLDLFDSASSNELPPEERPLLIEEAEDIINTITPLFSTSTSIALIKGESAQTLPGIIEKINNVDKTAFIFIDGGHSYETALEDMKNALQFSGDIIMAIDDFKFRTVYAATLGFHEIATSSGRQPVMIDGINENLCVMKIPKNDSKAN